MSPRPDGACHRRNGRAILITKGFFEDDHARLIRIVQEIVHAQTDSGPVVDGYIPELIRITGRALLHLRQSEPRFGKSEWPWLSGISAGDLDSRQANKFLCACILEMQAGTTDVWDNTASFVKEILNEPDNIWKEIRSHSPRGWAEQFWEYELHPDPMVHNRLYDVAGRMLWYYHGDARQIWEGLSDNPREIFHRIRVLHLPRSTACLVIGALKDEGYVEGAFDIVGDVVDSRVLARVVCGEAGRITPYQSRMLARRIYARDPWILDRPLYVLGMTTCTPGPGCHRCPVSSGCLYSVSRSLGVSVGTAVYERFFGRKTVQKSLKSWL